VDGISPPFSGTFRSISYQRNLNNWRRSRSVAGVCSRHGELSSTWLGLRRGGGCRRSPESFGSTLKELTLDPFGFHFGGDPVHRGTAQIHRGQVMGQVKVSCKSVPAIVNSRPVPFCGSPFLRDAPFCGTAAVFDLGNFAVIGVRPEEKAIGPHDGFRRSGGASKRHKREKTRGKFSTRSRPSIISIKKLEFRKEIAIICVIDSPGGALFYSSAFKPIWASRSRF
jgi:hypothetical protein